MDHVLALLALQELYGPLSRKYIDRGRFPLFESAAIAEAHERRIGIEAATGIAPRRRLAIRAGGLVSHDGRLWRLANLGQTVALLVDDASGEHSRLPIELFEDLVSSGGISPIAPEERAGLPEAARARLDDAAPEDLEEAAEHTRELHRYRDRVAEGHFRGDRRRIEADLRADGFTAKLRTLQDWGTRWDRAEADWGWGFIGLIRRPNRGRPGPRLEPQLYDLAYGVIEADYKSPKGIRPTRAYSTFVARCESLGLDHVPSYGWFRSLFDPEDPVALVAAREGVRSAYELMDLNWDADGPLDRHGSFPWHIVHLDSTELQVEVSCYFTGRGLGRPWLHLAIDAYSRRVLAFVLTFEPPSHRSTIQLVRRMVQLWRRLPQYLVHDGGREYICRAVDQLCAHFGTHHMTRPASKPRFGAVIERLFLGLQTNLIDWLRGTTKLTRRDVRQVTAAVDPKGQRVWDLVSLQHAIDEWNRTVYEVRPHATLAMSPLDAYSAGIAALGERPMRYIELDREFELEMMPRVDRAGTRKVGKNSGVKVGGIRYWHPLFRDHRVRGQKVNVRADPWDARRVFVYVLVPPEDRPQARGQWVEAANRALASLEALTTSELEAASEEFRELKRQSTGDQRRHELQLAEFLLELQRREKWLLLHLRYVADREVREGPARLDAETLLARPVITPDLLPGGIAAHLPEFWAGFEEGDDGDESD